ncbi:MAG TPA: methyltransferase domain-containing protein [Rhodocyclaceae bacterium]
MRWIKDALGKALSSWVARHGLDHPASRQPSPFDFDLPGRKFLHVGCGSASKPAVPKCFLPDEWREIRLDIDPAVSPDVVASMLDMAPVPDARVDGIYSSHNIEHLYPHEVPVALGEFLRVLKPGGFLVATCPDLQSVSRLIADDRLEEPAYVSAVGPIAPLDILYGHRSEMAAGNLFMAHRTGFTLRTLVDAVRAAGFASVGGLRRERWLDLWIVATKSPATEDEIARLMEACLPNE